MKKRYRMLALVLSACMMFNLAPITALADESELISEEVTLQDSILTETEEAVSKEPEVEDSNDEVDAESSQEIEADESDTVDAPAEQTEGGSTTDEIIVDEASEDEDDTDTIEVVEEEEQELTTITETESEYFTSESGVLKLKEGKTISDIGDNPVITADMIKAAGNVTTIDDTVFAGSNIKSITIPSTVTTFANGAFANCTNLTTVAFENNTTQATTISQKMFSGCSSLQWSGSYSYFKIPTGITTIDKYAFENCSALTGMNFSSTVSTIGERAFTGCSELNKLENFSSTVVTSIGAYAFNSTAINRDIEFPSTLTYISNHAFASCSNLGSIDLSNITGTLTLDSYCFSGSGLTGIKLPDTYTNIDQNVFAQCDSLKKITIGSDTVSTNVQSISSYAFKNCTNLKTVILKNSVTSIEDDAFDGCTSLKEVKIYQQDTTSKKTTITLSADSIPANDGLIIYSYSGTGEVWAGTHTADGVSYKSLFTGMYVATNTQYNGNAISVSPSSNVNVGSTVTVTPKAANGYTLISLTHGPGQDFIDSSKKFTVTSSDINSKDNIEVDAAFISTSGSSNFEFESATSGETISQISQSTNKCGYTFDTANKTLQLKIRARNVDKYDDDYSKIYSNPWLWSFASSDSKTVSVDATGNIKALKQTASGSTVDITATLKTNKNIKVTLEVEVAKETKFSSINDIELDTSSDDYITDGTDTTAEMKYVQTSKAWVEAATANKGTRNFVASVDALDTEGTSIQSSFKWVSGNTNIAKVASAKTNSNDNTIKICGVGETIITATSTVDSTKSISFIVRVVDMTPYVLDSTITINAPATEVNSAGSITSGEEFSLVQSYGGTISSKHMSIVQKKNNKYTSLSDYFAISKSGDLVDDVQTMQIAIKEGTNYYTKNATYTNLYIKMLVDGSYYYVPLPKVTIVNKSPAPKAKLTGYINTFYTASASEQSAVTAKITSPKGYSFDTATTPYLECLSTDTDSNFTTNFKVTTTSSTDFSTLTIEQNAEELVKNSKGKVITTGYLCFAYEGYDVCKLKITIPTKQVKPNLSLDKTTISTHSKAVGQSFELSVYDKKAKANIDLDDTYTVSYTARSNDYFSGSIVPTIDETNDKIVVTLGNTAPASGAKAYIMLSNDNWTDDMIFTVTAKVSSANPTFAYGNKQVINLNVANSTSNYITFNSNNEFMDAESLSFEAFTTTEKNTVKKANAEKITVAYNDGKITASLESEVPACNTYTYSADYTIKYAGSNRTYSGTAVVKVKVYNLSPSMKLKSGAVTLNDYFVGAVDSNSNPVEVATTTYTVNNTAQNATNAVNNTSFTITNNTKKKTYDTLDDAPIKVTFADGVMSVYLLEELGAKNQKFTISNIKIDGIDAPNIVFTVKSIDKTPSITLKGKGGINVLESSSNVTYTVQVKYYNGTVDANKLSIVAQDSSAANNATWITDSTQFHFVLDSASGNTVYLKANPTYTNSISNRKYTMKAVYSFNDTIKTSEVKIATKPKQTMPKVTLSSSKATVYTGNKSKTASITVAPKTGSTAVISGVEWGSKTSTALKKAFATPVYDESTGALTIQLKNAAVLKKNTTYTLYYNIQCEGQLTNTTGTSFAIKVTVK